MNNRRRVVVGFASMLAAPSIAFAQSQRRVPRIVWFAMGTPESARANNQAFREGLRALGYVEGKNIIVEYRFGHGKVDQLAALIDELLRLNPDCVVSGGRIRYAQSWERRRPYPS